VKQFLHILLIPVARLCFRYGISLQECLAALKTALLTVAREELDPKNETATASRLSIMSGVHRKDAARFLKGASSQRETIAPAIKVLGAWNTKRKYLDRDGKPRALSAGSEESDFSRLVREVFLDVHPHTVLKELERLRLVEVSSNEVTAKNSSFVSSVADETTANLISRDVNELLLSAAENIETVGRRPNHHTTTRFDNIPEEHLVELREWVIKEAGLFHLKVRTHIAKYDRDVSDKGFDDSSQGTIQFTFGSFGSVRVTGGGGHDKP